MFQTSSYRILLLMEDYCSVKIPLEQRNHVVDVVNNGLDAISLLDNIEDNQYDVILLDLEIPKISGWSLLSKIRFHQNTKQSPIIVHTKIDDELSEIQALNLGADDYIVKPCSTKMLLARIEAKIRIRVSNNSIDMKLPFDTPKCDDLTSRELEILTYIAKGYTNKQIADKAFITTLTAASHVKRIFKKLNVNNRTQAVLVAIKNQLILSFN